MERKPNAPQHRPLLFFLSLLTLTGCATPMPQAEGLIVSEKTGLTVYNDSTAVAAFLIENPNAELAITGTQWEVTFLDGQGAAVDT